MFEYNAEVIKITDADTLICNVDLGFNIWMKEKFRLELINAPELSTPEGQIAKKAVIELLASFNNMVKLKVKGKDKYGRWLAMVYIDEINLNQWLLDHNYAVKY